MTPLELSAHKARIAELAQGDALATAALVNAISDPSHGPEVLDFAEASRLRGRALGQLYLKHRQQLRPFVTALWVPWLRVKHAERLAGRAA